MLSRALGIGLFRRKYGLEYLAVMAVERLGGTRPADRLSIRITPTASAA